MKDKISTPLLKNLCKFFVFLGLLGFSPVVNGQYSHKLDAPISELTVNESGDLECEIHANDTASSSHHAIGSSKSGLAASARNKMTLKSKKSPTGAQIFVQYFNFDPNFSQEDFVIAATTFQSAVDIWASSISSDVPIFVAAVFQQLGPGTLGSAGPTSVYANAPGLERDSWYGNALADKLVGEDLDPTSFDIIARFSTVFPNWYYGTDANPPAGDFDFRTVVLHELCHGLGFFGSMFVDNATGIGSYGFGIPSPVFPAIYDRLANSPDGKSILKENRYGNFTTELGDVLLGGPLTAKGPRIKKATNGKGAQLFTVLDSEVFGDIPGFTDIWLPGSSYSHLDFLTYAGSPDGLMVPFLSRGLAFDDPGAITLAIFDDLGWNGKVNREVKEPNNNSGGGDDPAITDSGISISPNPFVNSVQLDLTADKRKITKAMVLDVAGSGVEIASSRIQGSSNVNIDLSGITNSTDLYFLQITFDNGDTEVFKLYKSN